MRTGCMTALFLEVRNAGGAKYFQGEDDYFQANTLTIFSGVEDEDILSVKHFCEAPRCLVPLVGFILSFHTVAPSSSQVISSLDQGQ